jgi:hypothetical protein
MLWMPVPIQVDGAVVGAAVPQEHRVRFVAVDWRVGELDQTLWDTADAARSAAEQMMRTGKVRDFYPPAIEE